MTKIESFKAKKAREIVQDDALKAMQATAEKFGLTVKRGPGVYMDSSFEMKFEFCIPSADGKPTGKEAEAFTFNAAYLEGLEADDLGRWFDTGKKKFRIVGLRARAQKKPIIIEDEEGTQYTTSEEMCACYLKDQRETA